eukprot:717374-Pleurochrysis_carterae.AAC.3
MPEIGIPVIRYRIRFRQSVAAASGEQQQVARFVLRPEIGMPVIRYRIRFPQSVAAASGEELGNLHKCIKNRAEITSPPMAIHEPGQAR